MRPHLGRITGGPHVGRVGLVVLLLVVGLADAWAADRLDEAAEAGRWLFPPERLEVGGYVGGGLALQNYPRDGTIFVLIPRVGYVFWQQDRFLPGSLEVLVEPAYYAVHQTETASVFSGSLICKYNFATGTRLTPFLEGGAGVSYATRAVPEVRGSHFNFVLQAGLGLQYAVGDRNTLSLSWRYIHLSNAHLYPTDPSLNTGVFLLGFSHLF